MTPVFFGLILLLFSEIVSSTGNRSKQRSTRSKHRIAKTETKQDYELAPLDQSFKRLILAIDHHNIDHLKRAIEEGAKLNVRFHDGSTPLIRASLLGNATIVKFLLDHGAYVNFAAGTSETAIYAACYKRNYDAAEVLLRHGADVDARGKYGTTSLMLAVTRGFHLTKLLIDHGADVNAVDENGVVPILVAAGHGDFFVGQLLVDHGADMKRVMKAEQMSPLFIAAKYGRENFLKMLVRNGAEIDSPTSTGFTPLMQAVFNGNRSTVEFLVKQGANVNARAHRQLTPLMVAATEGNPELTRFLLEHGADVNARTKENMTALAIASIHGRSFEVVEILVESGADVFFKDFVGDNAYDVAKKAKNFKIAKFLHSLTFPRRTVTVKRTQTSLEDEID